MSDATQSNGEREEAMAPGRADSSEQEKGLAIVGVGASAGGLNALKSLLGSLPEKLGAAIVIVVHLSPEHESHLADLLQPHCHKPIEQVTETVKLEADQVYIIPPNAHLESIDSHLRLAELSQERGKRSTIDHFFRTLAQTSDGNAIGIVLTGSGSDGTLGLRWIKEGGGVTIAQDPDEAEFDGMPRSAISSGVVDLALPLEEITKHVARIVKVQPIIPEHIEQEEEQREEKQSKEDDAALLHKIFASIRGRTGHDFSVYKRSMIMRRIQRRMQLQQIENLSQYVELLRSDDEEARQLFDDLLINVTEFLRDAKTFDAIGERIMPQIFEQKGPDDTVRIWSVGCSTGEEAYSLAMLAVEEASQRESPPEIQVFASDLHERSLRTAREGIYPASISESVSEERLRRFFLKRDSTYHVRPELRERVVFAAHNLLRDPPFSKLDLIVCRNLLIYLERDVQEDVTTLFHYALRPNGLVVLGASETMEQSELFALEDKKHCIYRKRNVPTGEARMLRFQPVRRSARAGEALADADRDERRDPPTKSYGEMHAQMAERYAPPSILVSEQNNVVHISAHAGQYLEVAGGEPTSNVFKLLLEPLRLELRSALLAAKQEGRFSRSRAVSVTIGGEEHSVMLRVRPALTPEEAGFYLVIFDEIDSPTAESEGEGNEYAATNRELEAELQTNRERLQHIVEEYETSQEEMQASNEELQSANEELRSTLEELETSKEELQSMNEELTTVNQENRHRVEELAQLSADLQNLLAATEIATIFLDSDLRIVRYTPKVADLFNIQHSDRGRPLADLTHRLGKVDLTQDAREVLGRLSPVEREIVSEDERWYLMRILPYRSTEDRIEGVVVTLVDITQRKKHEDEMQRVMGELNHRVKNTLAVVLAIAKQTARRTDSLEAFTGAFEQRLQAIAKAHSLLTKTEWHGAELAELVASETGSGGDAEDRFVVSGAPVMLRPKVALAVHMVLHELTTNARKHGALQPGHGRVVINWRVKDDEAQGEMLELEWEEHCDAPVEPAGEEGAGSRLVEQVVEYELGGQLTRTYEAEGLRIAMRFPVEAPGGGEAPPDAQPRSSDPMIEANTPAGRPAKPGTGTAPASDGDSATGRGVLVVEDNALLAAALGEALLGLGYAVIGPASTLAQGQALAKADGVCAAVLDVNLDGEKVYDLARELRDRGIPFVLLTGYDTKDLPEDLQNEHVMSKPMDLELVGKWLEAHC